MKPSLIIFTLLLLLSTGWGCASTPNVQHVEPAPRDFSACFYDFTEVYPERIYRVLISAPGARDVHRIWTACENPEKCICYALVYDWPVEELESWIRKELPVSKAVPFRVVPKGDHRMEVYFDGGFH